MDDAPGRIPQVRDYITKLLGENSTIICSRTELLDRISNIVGISKEELLELEENGKELDAIEAKELGFCHQIINNHP